MTVDAPHVSPLLADAVVTLFSDSLDVVNCLFASVEDSRSLMD